VPRFVTATDTVLAKQGHWGPLFSLLFKDCHGWRNLLSMLGISGETHLKNYKMLAILPLRFVKL
jgi:hypothetical protein